MTAVKIYLSAGKMLTQGFQQTWDISTATKEVPQTHFSFSIYPNPTNGLFNLVTETNVHEPFTVIILDILGKRNIAKKIFPAY